MMEQPHKFLRNTACPRKKVTESYKGGYLTYVNSARHRISISLPMLHDYLKDQSNTKNGIVEIYRNTTRGVYYNWLVILYVCNVQP